MSNSFSVLMSLYDKENASYLQQCLASLDEQALKPSEIVMVYDGPIRDELRLVVNRYKEKLTINIVELEKNVGLGNALNHGLQHCCNDIVARMDTDDICMPFRFEKQINFMHLHPEIAVLGSAIDEYDETMCVFLGTRRTRVLNEDIRNYSKLRSPFNHMAVVFRKKVILDVGGYKDHPFMEDYNLWLRVLSNNHKVYNFDESLVLARTGVSMLKRRKGFQYISSELKLAKLKYKLCMQSFSEASTVFLFRVMPRLLPNMFLKIVYKKLRSGK
ncbi:glycosyltransferase [Budvicia aquatica]|uniref:glycosyltransferase n=1 Tax=Budvicia aquatica TaxID=82979 RepID=UPI00208C2533|nr:glycosyltransferase [Budvicia aquatica]GKX51173.1 amylovoran biosynthesis protein AmsE [Budvicia aquatica]